MLDNLNKSIVSYAKQQSFATFAWFTMNTDPSAPIESLLQTIGENLHLRLKQASLDQKEMAKLSDLNRNTISAALSGKDLKVSTLIRITRTLGFSDWLVPLLDPPPVSPMESLLRKNNKKIMTDVSKPASRSMGRKKDHS